MYYFEVKIIEIVEGTSGFNSLRFRSNFSHIQIGLADKLVGQSTFMVSYCGAQAKFVLKDSDNNKNLLSGVLRCRRD